MTFVRFMSTPTGRGLRVVVGLALIAIGVRAGGLAGWGLAAFGVLPLATGAADICPICPLLGDDRRTRAQCKGSSCR
jgi:hypothetical protein